MIKYAYTFLIGLILFSCNESDNPGNPSIEAPVTYTFERDGQSTVSFGGQTTRIKMGEELIDEMLNFSSTEVLMLEMYRNETADGGVANPFSDSELNSSSKSIKSKTAASRDYFSSNTSEGSIIKNDFETWIEVQVNNVFPNENQLAAPGVAGQLADGSSTRYVAADGLEYNQAVNKSMIGALMADQALNHYLSPAVLNEADNVERNDNGVVADGENYTTMEHKWDEAFGYVYGTSADPSNPNTTIGQDDSFLNKYIGRVESDEDFAGIADEIFDAFKLGRAAIVAGDYILRDEQAAIIRQKISEVIAIRAVYYLQQGKVNFPSDRTTSNAFGPALHDLSEGFGFIYSLRFTRNPATDSPFFTKSEVDGFLTRLLSDGENGLWDVKDETLDQLSDEIATKFDFTVTEAGS